MKKSTNLFYLLIVLFLFSCSASETAVVNNAQATFNPDTVTVRKFDTGKMWTFEDAPVGYFEDTYGFKPDEDWFKDARLSALQFASWCSSSFVSEDGLIMTNHHCIDFKTKDIQEEGENILKNGFYAETLEDERKVPGVFVDQLILTKDVTNEIKPEVAKGKTLEEKLELRSQKIAELEKQYSEETELKIKIVPLYNGGKYSLYGYRTYNDVRMVLALESEVGLYGGDPDNFTYPRYNCDFAFLRVYQDGKPLKTKNFFEWSKEGPKEGEPLFCIGRPGRTERLKTMAQYEYMRDYTIRNTSYMLNFMVDLYERLMAESEEARQKYSNTFTMITNSAKVYRNQYKALNDEYLMARKKAFETELRMKVSADPQLNKEYGTVWNEIETLTQEKRKYAPYLSVFQYNGFIASGYLKRAQKLLQLNKKEGLIEDADSLKLMLDEIYDEEDDSKVDFAKLELLANLFEMNIGKNAEYNKYFGNNSGKKAAQYMIDNSFSSDREKLEQFILDGGDLSKSDDKFIQFIQDAPGKVKKATARSGEIRETESVLNELLGQVIFALNGTNIPPDATSTLRINDGVMRSFDYNGTIAPINTTFYGLYNRYYSHKKIFPWDLPKKWLDAEDDMVLSTPLNFVTTNDITGGSSGSPVINQKQEIVGIAFDGNVESIAGSYLYDDKQNRMVAVHSSGILEAIGKVYKANRIVKELKTGKIAD